MTQLIPFFLFQLLKGKFYHCSEHDKTNSILGLDDERCCDLVIRSTEMKQVPLDAFSPMKWSCENCFSVNSAANFTCDSVLCVANTPLESL